MLVFGKKANFRPLLVCSLSAAIFAFFTQGLFNNLRVTVGVALFFFFEPFLLNYFLNLPWVFPYWKVNSDSIQYTDIVPWGHRLLALIFPPAIKFKTIMKKDIALVKIIGDLNKSYSMTPVTYIYPIIFVYTPAIFMAHNQDYARIYLKDGHSIDLRFSRDYVYDRAKTIEKLEQLSANLAKDNINVVLPEINVTARPKMYY